MIDESWSETTEFIFTCIIVFIVLISIQFYEDLADGWMSMKTALIILFGKTIQKVGIFCFCFGKKLIRCSVKDDKSTQSAEFEVLPYFEHG